MIKKFSCNLILICVVANLFIKTSSANKICFNGKNRFINVTEFGVLPVKNLNESDDAKYRRWKKLVVAFDYCVRNKRDLFFPKGIYDVGVRNFPFRQNDMETEELFDCNHIMIFGEGKETLLKTSSYHGADVLQLNMIKNITIKNISITADLYTEDKAGSNGISITNGFDNIILDNIYIYNLPSVDKGNYIDGGKGLTLQFDPDIKSKKGTLIATKIYVENCAYGFRFDAVHVSDLLKEKINITLDMEVDHSFQGFSMSFGVPSEKVRVGSALTMQVKAVLKNCQQFIAFSRVIGGNYNFIVDKTEKNYDILRDQDGKIWYRANSLLFGFLCNYAKEVNTTISGDVGKVNTKVWMGAVGSVVEPFNLSNSTESSKFYFNILGTSFDKDFTVINYLGDSIHNSSFLFSSNFSKDKGFLLKIKNNKNLIKVVE